MNSASLNHSSSGLSQSSSASSSSESTLSPSAAGQTNTSQSAQPTPSRPMAVPLPNTTASSVATAARSTQAVAAPAPKASQQTTQMKDPTILKHQQQRLLLLRHAAKCQAEPKQCKVTPHCDGMKNLWKHISACDAPKCRVPHCISSRYVLSHYHRCKNTRCEVCEPVRTAIKRSKVKEVRAQRGMRAANQPAAVARSASQAASRSGNTALSYSAQVLKKRFIDKLVNITFEQLKLNVENPDPQQQSQMTATALRVANELEGTISVNTRVSQYPYIENAKLEQMVRNKLPPQATTDIASQLGQLKLGGN